MAVHFRNKINNFDKKINRNYMAISNFVAPENIAYSGKSANEIMSKPVYETDLYGYGITYRPNVKGKEQLMVGEVGDLFQAYTCAFTPQGEVALDDSWIEPFNIKINLQECYDKFWPSFMAEETRRAYVGETNIPRTFFQWFFDEMLVKKMKEEYEEIFWNGDTAYTGTSKTYLALGDGIVKKVKAASATTHTNGGLTVANILDKIAEVAADADVNVDESEYKIFVNKGQMKMIKTALGNRVADHSNLDNLVWSNWTKEGDKIFAYGFEIVPTRIEKDTILLAPTKNLILGYDLESDQTKFDILDLSKVTGDNEFRVIALCNMAVGVVFGSLMSISTK